MLNDLYSLAIRDLPQFDHFFFVPREFGYKKDGEYHNFLDNYDAE